jgi:hypothetical protein
MAELNKCWYLVPGNDKLKECTRGWWESAHHNLSYNWKEKKLATVFQPGGTAVLSVDSSSHRVLQSGQDPKGLGRWSWTLFEASII